MIKGSARQKVHVRESVDDRFYGTLDETIAYLKEVKRMHGDKEGIGIEEHWTGYEDMEMVISYWRDETDDEMSQRLSDERAQKARAKAKQKEDEQRKRDMADYERLRSKLGMSRY